MTILSPTCRCGHALAVHDPCSQCECPGFKAGKAKKYPPRSGWTHQRFTVDFRSADR